MNIQIATDRQGKKSAVIIPFRDWELLQNKLHKLEAEQKVLLGINEAMQEVKAIVKGNKKGKTLQSFLSEL